MRCKACNRALSGQDAKSGKLAYYVCQSVMKRGSGACDAPRLNARRFEEKVVGKIRENVLTESNIRALVKLVDEEMDGVAKEQRQKLETIESELVDVKRRLGRLYDLAETTDLDIDDFKPRIREHRERQERLEATAAEARTVLSQRREVLDDVETITAYALDMSMFLNESELTERRAFIESFVKEIVVMPDNAVVRYTIPISQSTRKAQVLVGSGSEESAEPLQFIAPRLSVGLPVGGKVKLREIVAIRHPHERYGHVSEIPARAPVLLQPRLGDPWGHRILAALSHVDQMEPTASLTPTHEALARLAHPDNVTGVAGEADRLWLPPHVPARLRSFAQFERRKRQAGRPYPPGLAFPGLTRLPPFAYAPP